LFSGDSRLLYFHRRTKSSHYALQAPKVYGFGYSDNFCSGNCSLDFLNVDANAVVLEPNSNFRVKENLERLLKNETNEDIDGSMGVIITDIPCPSFLVYPDVSSGRRSIYSGFRWTNYLAAV
jgi:hypothetical protein